MVRRKTNEEYINECKQLGIDLPIEEYKGAHTPIKHKCKKGHVYKQQPSDNLRGIGCKYCSGKVLKTNETYIKECKQLGLDLPIDNYKGTHSAIKHKCRECGNVYKQSPSSHLQGRGCPLCANDKIREQKIISNGEYIRRCIIKDVDLPIERYKGSDKKLRYLCRKCNRIYKQQAYVHLLGHGCNYCSGMIKKYDKNYYMLECKEKGLDLPIERYINSYTPIKHKCVICGREYMQKPNDHLDGHGCSYCIQSKGEQFIQNYLNENNIPYEPQKKFKDLKDKNLLSYDFYLPKQKMLIEYQGIQHFTRRGKGLFPKDYFPTQQYHDKLKREYAANNGYILLEPTYKLDTQEKVNKYLDKYL